jgi:hypothetical protein
MVGTYDHCVALKFIIHCVAQNRVYIIVYLTDLLYYASSKPKSRSGNGLVHYLKPFPLAEVQ